MEQLISIENIANFIEDNADTDKDVYSCIIELVGRGLSCNVEEEKVMNLPLVVEDIHSFVRALFIYFAHILFIYLKDRKFCNWIPLVLTFMEGG